MMQAGAGCDMVSNVTYIQGDPESRLILTAPHGGYCGKKNDSEDLAELAALNLVPLPLRDPDGTTDARDSIQYPHDRCLRIYHRNR